MEVSRKTVRGTFSRLWARLGGSDLAQKYAGDELPLRSELFSVDQMEQHGKILAGVHQLKPGRPRDRLLARLAENENLLLEVHNLLTEAVKVGPPDYTGRGMAARQLLCDRRTDSHGQATLAEGLQPGAAALVERPIGRASAGV